ncbi:MAG: exodeoxyribonuclease VII large subunit, partial [Firmicutes bacterium]|nr:exodeoxyribonuclease VII large subunit [Bacillota bacterium]
ARALSELTLRIAAASPNETLKRGYAIVRRGKSAVQSVTLLKPDDLLTITFADGSAEARTIRIHQEDL